MQLLIRLSYFTSLIVLVISISACGAKKTYVSTPYDYKASWHYFDLKDTINGTIINHYPAEVFCGTMAFGSVSIIKTESDTIRVLDLCNMTKIEVGKIVKISPSEKPSFNVNFSTMIATFERNDTIYQMPTAHDVNILKTTWGSIN